MVWKVSLEREVREMPDLLSSDRLIVNQKAKLIEVTNQYLIRDAQGEELGLYAAGRPEQVP